MKIVLIDKLIDKNICAKCNTRLLLNLKKLIKAIKSLLFNCNKFISHYIKSRVVLLNFSYKQLFTY